MSGTRVQVTTRPAPTRLACLLHTNRLTNTPGPPRVSCPWVRAGAG
jgi:hypothetical protein